MNACLPGRTNLLLYFEYEVYSMLPFWALKLFLCSFLQGVDTMHSLTDGKLLTVKLKEAKKSLDSMWIKFKGDFIIDVLIF